MADGSTPYSNWPRGWEMGLDPLFSQLEFSAESSATTGRHRILGLDTVFHRHQPPTTTAARRTPGPSNSLVPTLPGILLTLWALANFPLIGDRQPRVLTGRFSQLMPTTPNNFPNTELVCSRAGITCRGRFLGHICVPVESGRGPCVCLH